MINTAMLKVASTPTSVDWHIHFENIDIGIMTTIMGICIVFLILIIICLVLAIFSLLVRDKNKDTQTTDAHAKPRRPIISVKKPKPAETNLMDDKELVAVITAAIAASMGKNCATGTDGLVVRRIRRVGNWNQDAIEQHQNSIY